MLLVLRYRNDEEHEPGLMNSGERLEVEFQTELNVARGSGIADLAEP